MIIQSPQVKSVSLVANTMNNQKEGIFEQIPLPACIVNLNNQEVTRTNQAFKNFLEAYSLEIDEINFPYTRLTNGQTLLSEEFTLISKKKRQVTFLLTANETVKDNHGDLTQIIYLNDITYMKKIEADLEHSEARLGESSLTKHIGFWNADPVSGMCYVCPTMAKDWGFDHSKNPVHSDQIMNAIHPSDRAEIWMAVEKSLLQNVPYYCEYRVIRPDGSTVWIEGRGEYIKDINGHPFRFTGTSTNITDRVEAKLKLAQEVEELKETVSQLKQTQALAEHANKNKTVFLANVSHEIRTPLTAILGFADLLKDGPISDIEKTQFAETINRNGNALIKIIDDVLDLSKVEANCLELEKIELSPQQLLHDVVHQFKAKARAKGIYVLLDIQNELPQTILSDSVRIQQVLTNLLSNAIKFTDQGGVIVQVKSYAKKQSKAEIQIRVIDTGIGLTEDQKERLFQPFSQAESSTTRKFGGNGLGLALSKHLAEALGGQLIIERSEKDMGCTFAFTLTADVPAASVIKIETKKSSQQMDFVPLSGFNILLAEDSVDNQYFVEKFLTKHGATVSVVGNGHEVLEQTAKQNFDIILMDIEMPEMDGYEATRLLRARGFSKPILALTAHAMAEERSKTRDAGCDGHLTKPIDTAQLLAALENHLKKSNKKKR